MDKLAEVDRFQGGACISPDNTGRYGVTNHFGEVLKGNGTATHKGLVVVDGATIPAALGANPLATITALAERAVDIVAEEKNIYIDYNTRNGKCTGEVLLMDIVL